MARFSFKAENIYNTRKVVKEGMYWLTVGGFSQKWTKPKEGETPHQWINFNPILELTATTDSSPVPLNDDGSHIRIWYPASQKFEASVNEFSHACGLPLDIITDPQTKEESATLPGIWTPENEDDIEKCTYKGPLVGKKLQAYIVKGSYQGTEKNEIKFFVCAVPNCNQKFPKLVHIKNLIQKKKAE